MILAWHFVGDTLRDGRPIPADGEVLRHDDTLELCASGLHASEDPFDALQYAPGATLCRVECGGRIVHGHDKLVCAERTILWRIDADPVLWGFARWCALQVIDLWDAHPVVREYLESGDESLRSAAWAAARAAARDAAWDAAREAARDAQRAKLLEMVEAAKGGAL